MVMLTICASRRTLAVPPRWSRTSDKMSARHALASQGPISTTTDHSERAMHQPFVVRRISDIFPPRRRLTSKPCDESALVSVRRRRAVFAASALLALVLSLSEAKTASAQDESAVVVLVDVSGSIAQRPSGWYEALRNAAEGIVTGSQDWRSKWKFQGKSALLDSIAALHATQFAIVPFGTASASSPYFTLSSRPAPSALARGQQLLQRFPPASAFRQGKTFVSLAQATIADQLDAQGISSAYVIVLSDFQQDADLTAGQRELTARYETASLPFRAGEMLSAQLGAAPAVDLRIVRLVRNGSSAATTARPASPTGKPTSSVSGGDGIRLLRPGSVVVAGPVTFVWTTVAGAATYALQLRRDGGRGNPQQFIIPATSKVVPNLTSGDYQWTLTARTSGLSTLASRSGRLEVRSDGSVGGAVLAVLVIVGSVAGAVWYLRRRRFMLNQA
jgi:hypothetical protein